MIIQVVKFQSGLPDEAVRRVMKERSTLPSTAGPTPEVLRPQARDRRARRHLPVGLGGVVAGVPGVGPG